MSRINKLIAPIRQNGILMLQHIRFRTVGTPKYTEEELAITLKSKFVKAKDIQVKDISGGCGSMYEIVVESSEFQRMTRVKQHQMVVDTLKEQIKDMHGVRIQTIAVK